MELHMHKKNLEDFKRRIREKYPELTDADLTHQDGMKEKMLRMIAYKLKKIKLEMNSLIAGL
ncbi:MAG: hypothetical protein K0B15_14185 [Lentimicrobium sp.]|nr:hypothetical protein [Lentimicrobium sp.]